MSERPRLDNRLGGELEGSALDRAILNGDDKLGVKPFLDTHSDELTRMTDEDQKFVKDKSKPDRQRAGRLFENLRRVEINLVRVDPVLPGSISVTNFEHVHNCPRISSKRPNASGAPASPSSRRTRQLSSPGVQRFALSAWASFRIVVSMKPAS